MTGISLLFQEREEGLVTVQAIRRPGFRFDPGPPPRAEPVEVEFGLDAEGLGQFRLEGLDDAPSLLVFGRGGAPAGGGRQCYQERQQNRQ